MTPYLHSFQPDRLTGEELDQLLALGWYRMHQTVFTVSHLEQGDLYRVHWLRYALKQIKKRATHKRIRSRTKRFRSTIENVATISAPHQQLHAHYRASIDFEGAHSIEECLFGEDESAQNLFDTKCISIYDGDILIAGGYFDVGATTAASILHFFDPKYARYSLGKYLILITIDYLAEHGYELYYPGYVVQGLPKMDYKLFLGREEAEYFDPEVVDWKKFDDAILISNRLDELSD